MHALRVVVGLLLVSHLAAAAAPRARVSREHQCNSDMQIVMCGQIPLSSIQERRACCRTFRSPVVSVAHAAAAVQAATAAGPMQEPVARPYRADLDANDAMRSAPLDWQYSSNCTAAIKVSPAAACIQPGEAAAPAFVTGLPLQSRR
jgi:hypothetical protein